MKRSASQREIFPGLGNVDGRSIIISQLNELQDRAARGRFGTHDVNFLQRILRRVQRGSNVETPQASPGSSLADLQHSEQGGSRGADRAQSGPSSLVGSMAGFRGERDGSSKRVSWKGLDFPRQLLSSWKGKGGPETPSLRRRRVGADVTADVLAQMSRGAKNTPIAPARDQPPQLGSVHLNFSYQLTRNKRKIVERDPKGRVKEKHITRFNEGSLTRWLWLRTFEGTIFARPSSPHIWVQLFTLVLIAFITQGPISGRTAHIQYDHSTKVPRIMNVSALNLFLLVFLATLAGCTGSEEHSVETEAYTGEFKILALHGGGGSPEGLMGQPGMQDLMSDLPEFEFFFADAPDDDSMCDQCWYADPPGGKGEPNEDRTWADISIEYLDGIVEEHGPFYGILGYSQGCPMATVYLANSNTSFEKAFLFNGYLPTTHSGLDDTINEVAPLSVDALIFGGANDVFIFGVDELAGVYQEPTIIISSTADHHLPSSDDETYGDVLAFFRQGTNGTL